MRAYLLVDGPSDEAVFRRLLTAELQSQTSIVVAGPRTNNASLARSLLIVKRKPVALVTDSDAVDRVSVQERRQTLEELLRQTAAGVPFTVILMEPEIESLFFAIPDALERLSGHKLTSEQQALAVFRPKEVLAHLFKGQGHSPVSLVLSGLTDDEVQALRETPPVKELTEFLSEATGLKVVPQPA